MASGPTAPELILPSEWLPVIWGGEEQFALNCEMLNTGDVQW